MEKELEIQEIRGFFRRRKKAFIIAFLLIFIIGVSIALLLPPIYTSEAMIRIEDQEIPESFVKSTITDYAEERIEKINQQILIRPKLLEIINEFNLYPDIRDKKTPTELVKKIRKDIGLEKIAARWQSKREGRPVAATVAFSLSYDGKDPVIVQKVVNKLSNLYLEEDIKKRGNLAAGTTDFLKAELRRLGTEISRHEQIISDFKQNHLRELPADRGYNLQAVARLERESDRLDSKQQLLEERRVLLQSQLINVEPLTPIIISGETLALNPAERLKKLRLELVSLQSIYSEKHPNIKSKKRQIAELEKKVLESDDSVEKVKKLKQLEVKLASTSAKLGPKHPDVKAIKSEIAILRKQVDNLVSKNVMAKVSEEKPDNPFYITLKTQLETIDMEIKALHEDRLQLESDMEEYQIRIENAPIVEKELNALTRDYDNLKRKYADISNKLMSSELVQEMEGKEKGDRFNITSPAYLPIEPSKPNRLMIIVLSFALAIGISTAFVAFLEYIDDSIKTSNQLKQLTNLPVFSAISYIENDEEKRKKRVKILIWAGAAAFSVAIALLIVDLFFMELDQVWEAVVARIMMIA